MHSIPNKHGVKPHDHAIHCVYLTCHETSIRLRHVWGSFIINDCGSVPVRDFQLNIGNVQEEFLLGTVTRFYVCFGFDVVGALS